MSGQCIIGDFIETITHNIVGMDVIGSDVTGAGVAITSGTVGAPVGAPVAGLQMSMILHLSLSPQNVEQHSSTVSNIVTPVIALPISLEHDLSAPPEPSIT